MGEELGRQCEVGAPGICSSLTLSHRGGWLMGLEGPWKGETGRWGAGATFLLIPCLALLGPWGTHSWAFWPTAKARPGQEDSQDGESSEPAARAPRAPRPQETPPWQGTQSESDRWWQGDVPFAQKS